jgi:lipopolysaccharide export system permease protein
MIFDRYLFRSLAIATGFIAVTLACVILLTQSLRFLELVIESGASGGAFLMLTFLSLPRFFEVILPIALMGAIIFIYNRMTMDSELVVMRGLGASSMALSRPALILSVIVMAFLFFITAWLGPATGNAMHQMRLVIKAEYSALFFREGVFNPVGKGVTVFVRDRAANGDLHGLMIHDRRPENPAPVTVTAKRGILVATDAGQQVIVFDGSRQAYDTNTGNLTRLDFSRYTIDLPDSSSPVRQRWQEPDERTLYELLTVDYTNPEDAANRRDFIVEIHRRIVSPFLAPAYAVIALVAMMLGPVERRGMARRIALAIFLAILIQSFYLAAFNMAEKSLLGLVFMYVLVFVPMWFGLYFLSGRSEAARYRLYRLCAPAMRRVLG